MGKKLKITDDLGFVCFWIPRWLWYITKPGTPLSFLSEWIVSSYMLDPKGVKSGLWHLLDAYKCWRKYKEK